MQLLGEALILCAEMKWFEMLGWFLLCKPRVRTGKVRSKEKKDKRAKAAEGVSVLPPARAAQRVQSGTTVRTYQRGTQSPVRPGFSPEF